MSTQINQYLILGIKAPANWPKKWEKSNPGKDWGDTFDKYMNDSAYDTKVKHKDGVFMLYDGMSGNYILIGKVYKKSIDGERIEGPLCIDDIPTNDKDDIANSIERIFGLKGDVKWYFVTHYR
jgi:hypothetical protein